MITITLTGFHTQTLSELKSCCRISSNCFRKLEEFEGQEEIS